MKLPNCCERAAQTKSGARHQRPWVRRATQAAQWVLPGTLLALMPKCPMCLVAYVALGSGLSLSSSRASLLLRLLTTVCTATLALCVIRHLLNFFKNKQSLNLQPSQTRL